MNITIDSLFLNFTLEDDNFPIYMVDFSKIEISIKYNCCDEVVFEDEILPNEDSSSSGSESEDSHVGDSEYSYIDENYNIIINRDILTSFATSYIPNGIYTINIKVYFNDNTLIYETYNCIFVDYDFNCQVVNYMSTNIGTEIATEVGVLYYALKNSSNCDCECDNICILYETLYNYLNDTNNINICGC